MNLEDGILVKDLFYSSNNTLHIHSIADSTSNNALVRKIHYGF